MLKPLQDAIRAVWELLLLIPMPWRAGFVILLFIVIIYQVFRSLMPVFLLPEFWITSRLRRWRLRPLPGTYAFGNLIEWTINTARWLTRLAVVTVSIGILAWYARPYLDHTTLALYIDQGLTWWYILEEWTLTGNWGTVVQAAPLAEQALPFSGSFKGTTTLKSTVTSISPIPLEDDFSKSQNNWVLSTNDDVVQTIEDGKLSITINTERDEAVAWTTLKGAFTDFTLEIDALYEGSVSNHEYGVLVRKIDDNNFYQFALVNNTFNAWKYENGEWTELQSYTPSSAINPPGETNRLKIIAHGTQFQFYSNGVLLTTLIDDTFSTGEIGLLAAIYDPGEAKVIFDNLVIY